MTEIFNATTMWRRELYPPLPIRREGRLPVDDLHTLYWEESGNPAGVPVLFLHGGPGSGTSPLQRRFFDPSFYRIILFDQRGAGKSTPLGECRNNTTAHLTADIEALRHMLEIENWLVFGGSWGSTLALAYAQTYPTACLGLILRGIFLCTAAEVDWFLNGSQWFHPEAHAKLCALIPPQEQDDLLRAYIKRLNSEDLEERFAAARIWSHFESERVTLLPDPSLPTSTTAETDAHDWSISRIEAHYMAHTGFFVGNQLLNDVSRIRHLPAVIIHGRYDVICPPKYAWKLHQAWPEARLHMIDDAGHSAFEPGILAALVSATEQFKCHRRFV